MKVLLDECLPVDFRYHLREHEVHTAQWAGFKGKKNGELLLVAEAAGYQALVTMDQGIPHQTPAGRRAVSILVLQSRTNQLEDLIPLAGAVQDALTTIRPGEIVTVALPT